MNCSICEKKAISTNPSYCRDHFIEYIENKVENTIKEHKMLSKKDSVCVAASGGKDSITVLYLLHKFGYKVEALAVDEGIEGYRDGTIITLTKFCKEHNIPLHIKSYEKEVGKRLDTVVPKGKPACHICGTFRRNLLNKYSEKYDKIATGHNLDDECQAVMMNILKGQTKLQNRQGPKTKQIEGFTQKIKPLYLLKEKEIMIYSVLKRFNTPFNECPYANQSYRAKVRDLLNELEYKKPGTKENIIKRYLKIKTNTSNTPLLKCNICGATCSSIICKSCKIKQEIALI